MENNNRGNNQRYNLNVPNNRIYNTVKQGKGFYLDRKGLLKVVATVVLVTSVFHVGLGKGAENERKKYNGEVVPNSCVATEIIVDIERGDTVSDIAARYYNDNYEFAYNSLDDYVKEIGEQNNLNKYSFKIEAGKELKIPVIVDKENEYYKKINALKYQIEEIENTCYWVTYKITANDYNPGDLAAKASSSAEETGILAKQIMAKNGMNSTSEFQTGMVIQTVNPKLGALKMELEKATEMLNRSISNESNIIK